MGVNRLLKVWNYIRKHKYMFTFVVFIIIIGFIDENSLVRRVQHQREIINLNSQIETYRKQYEEDSKMLKEITSNPQTIEKVAREKYYMKKPNEDIYIIQNNE
ncbi:FtsB family cell division protein [Phocaeicola paurosaccharolyticus]|jgi:cell division protein DivIC|uniref:FtsB family cell division protein n=1 Tax=Phocaeicola paurosaccharolyticus TaxID=732242 RepID=UPI000469C65F|nr:septum formation initiator family protein [Phocaeicola paurosaccharolyticus]